LADFKNVVRSLMKDAEKVLGEIAMLGDGETFVEQIHLLGHYLNYTRRLCQDNRPGNQHPCSDRPPGERPADTAKAPNPGRGSREALPMSPDIFGGLRDRGKVLDRIAQLKGSESPDEHQEGLTRILRYRGNRRLREAALKAGGDIASPADELLSQVLAVMMDEDVYWQARVMAAEALNHLIQKEFGGTASLNPAEAIEKIDALPSSPQPPAFHDGVRRFLKTVKGTERAIGQ